MEPSVVLGATAPSLSPGGLLSIAACSQRKSIPSPRCAAFTPIPLLEFMSSLDTFQARDARAPIFTGGESSRRLTAAVPSGGHCGRAAARGGGALRARMSIPMRIARTIAFYTVDSPWRQRALYLQGVLEMSEDLLEMRQAIAKVSASCKQSKHDYRQTEATTAVWGNRAELAIYEGDDELAREAIKRRRETWRISLLALQQQMEAQEHSVARLEADIEPMERRIQKAEAMEVTARDLVREAPSWALGPLWLWVDAARTNMEAGSALAASEKRKERVMSLDPQLSTADLSPKSSIPALEEQLDALERSVARLEADVELLESRLQEAIAMEVMAKDLLRAMPSWATEAFLKMTDKEQRNADASSALAASEKRKESVMSLYPESDVSSQLSTDDLSAKFAQLEARMGNDEMVAAMRKMLTHPERTEELPAGQGSAVSSGRSVHELSPEDEEVETELKNLRREILKYAKSVLYGNS